jgi:hypothetical protein
MAENLYGHYKGITQAVTLLLASSGTFPINRGDMLCLDSNGYAKQCGAGDVAYAVAEQYVKTAPASDGAKSISADICRETIYRYPPSAGTVSQAILGKTCDVGGAQSVDIAHTADDCLEIVGVDTTNNLVLVRLRPVLAGV